MGVDTGSSATCATLGSLRPTGSSNLASVCGVGSWEATSVKVLPFLLLLLPLLLAAAPVPLLLAPLLVVLLLAAPLLVILTPAAIQNVNSHIDSCNK